MRKADQDAFSLIGQLAQEGWTPPKSGVTKNRPPSAKRFTPKLNPGAQRQAYVSKKPVILGWSEKGSGKTWSFLHKLVRHCYKNGGALALVIVKVKSMANKGGAWEKLQRFVLPEWRRGVGLEYSDVKYDSQHNEMIWIQSESGGVSAVVLISAPHPNMIRDTMPGYEPSFAFVDELDKCGNDEYYKAVNAQIGRRPGIPTEEQQYTAACNPKGPRHWVYQTFFVEPRDTETGEWDQSIETVYFPSSENSEIDPQYFERLKKSYRNDPVELARLVGGEWIDKPSGDSLFGSLYSAILHVRPLTENQLPHPTLRLKPTAGKPIIIGIDSGSTYHSFSFLQQLVVDGRFRWVVFDEVLVLKKRTTYRMLMRVLARRLRWWYDVIAAQPPLIFISDDSAFKQWRPNEGSFDYMDMERAWNGDQQKGIPALREEFTLPEMKIKMCPKFPNSRKARIRIMINALSDEEILISAACRRHQDMLTLLESEAQKEGEEYDDDKTTDIKRSDHLHVFDSLTYPMLMNEVAPSRLTPQKDTQMLIRVGQGRAA